MSAPTLLKYGTTAAVADDGGGVIVLGNRADTDEFVSMRWNPAAGWQAPDREATGLTDLQTVVSRGRISLFGRDATRWYRSDFDASGTRRMQPVCDDETDSSQQPAGPYRYRFGVDATGDVVAVATVFSTFTLPTMVRTRSLSGAMCNAVQAFPLVSSLPGAPFSGPVRDRSGDMFVVNTAEYGQDYWLAGRLASGTGATEYTALTPKYCLYARCPPDRVRIIQPTIEADLIAGVLVTDTNAVPADAGWARVVGGVLTPIFSPSLLIGSPHSGDGARRVNPDGTAHWLTAVDGTYKILASQGASPIPTSAPSSYCGAAGGCLRFSSDTSSEFALLTVDSESSVLSLQTHARQGSAYVIRESKSLPLAGPPATSVYKPSVADFRAFADGRGTVVGIDVVQPTATSPAFARFWTMSRR